PSQLPDLRTRRDRLEPAAVRLRGHRQAVERTVRTARPPGAPGSDRAGDGGAVRTPVPGLARGLPAHGPARDVRLLRGVHPHRRLDGQPAREVVEGVRGAGVAPTAGFAELSAQLARVAAGPQR